MGFTGDKVVYVKEGSTDNPGTLMPVVILGGHLVGLFASVAIESRPDGAMGGLRPVLKLERNLYHPENEILTMTKEEFDSWCKSNEVT